MWTSDCKARGLSSNRKGYFEDRLEAKMSMQNHNTSPEIAVKRIYEPQEEADGFRVLVDRLWPRGLKKSEAQVDLWLKQTGPSTDLRKWFDHDPDKWEEFLSDYTFELRKNKALPELIEQVKSHKKVTLLYAARNQEYNNGVALKQFLIRYFTKN